MSRSTAFAAGDMVVNAAEQDAIAEVGYRFQRRCYLLSRQILGSLGCSLPLFNGPNRMAILCGNTEFAAVFVNVFEIGHTGNCAVMCASQPQPLSYISALGAGVLLQLPDFFRRILKISLTASTLRRLIVLCLRWDKTIYLIQMGFLR